MLGAKNVSIEVVERTIELAKLTDELSKDTSPTILDAQRIAQAKTHVNFAIVPCNTAVNVIAKLNNAFTTVNHAVSDAQLKLNAQIREIVSQMAAIVGASCTISKTRYPFGQCWRGKKQSLDGLRNRRKGLGKTTRLPGVRTRKELLA